MRSSGLRGRPGDDRSLSHGQGQWEGGRTPGCAATLVLAVLAVVLLPRYLAHLAVKPVFQSRGTYLHMDADEDMSEETLTKRMNDATWKQKRLYNTR